MEDRNPSPPPEFDNEEIYRPDSVGNTAISKHWVLTTLMEIINEVEKHADNEKEIVEVADELQDSTCKLWDICVDKDVAVYLMEFDIIEILYGVILKSKSPRLTEICVGILANMACNDVACLEISKLKHLRSVIVALLSSPDTPTLLESVRLLKITFSLQSCSSMWLSSIIEELDDFLSCVQFILGSSTNGKLLSSLSEILDMMIEKSSGILNGCCNKDFISALLEATMQQCQDNPSCSLHTLCHSLHALHLISETDSGTLMVVALRRNIASLLSSLFYQWMTSHPKVEYNSGTRMSSSEVSVSCCLSLASAILDTEQGSSSGHKSDKEKVNNLDENSKAGNESKTETKNNGENISLDIDDEDRELIIKFSQSIISAKGVVSALPVVSGISTENPTTNEFKTPLYFVKNSPRISTPNTTLLDKFNTPSDSLNTPVQTPEIHNSSPADKTPSRDNDDGDFTPTARERSEETKKRTEQSPSTLLCDLANKVLKIAQRFGWVINGGSPRKGLA